MTLPFTSQSQVFQDMFAYVLNGGCPGTFLDIGSAHPVLNNNTYELERQGWSGVCIDKDPVHVDSYRENRKSPFLVGNARDLNYEALFAKYQLKSPITYLSLDADDDTLAILEKLVGTSLRFRAITLEHDSYRVGNLAKERMRKILTRESYRLVKSDVSFNGNSFEDWWVDATEIFKKTSDIQSTPIDMDLPKTVTDYIEQRLQPTSKLRMEGWCTPEKASALVECVLTTRAKVALEIGVFAGRSLFAIGLAQAHLNEGGIAIGIDPWSPSASIVGFEDDPANRDWWSKVDHGAIFKLCEEVKKELALANVVLFRGTSMQAFPALTFGRPDTFVNLLHIDGNHSQQVALQDVQKYGPLVVEGGFIFFDDCDWSTTVPAQQELHKLATFVRMVGNCGVFVKK